MPTRTPPPEGFSDSDQQWFERVAGKPGPFDDSAAVREADALRMALERERERVADPAAARLDDDGTQARDWERLQFALAREGLLQPRRRPRWGWPAWGGLAAALLVSVALLPWWTSRDDPLYPEPPVLRGGPPVQSVAVADPRQSAEQLAARLREAGLAPGLFQQDDRFVVDLVLQPDQLLAAAPALQPLGLTPTPGLARFVFTRP